MKGSVRTGVATSAHSWEAPKTPARHPDDAVGTPSPSPESDRSFIDQYGEETEEEVSDADGDGGPQLAPLEVTDPLAVGSTVQPKEGPDGTCLYDKKVPQAVKSAKDEEAYRAQQESGAEAVKAEVPYVQGMTPPASASASSSCKVPIQSAPALTSTKCEVPTMHTQSASASSSGTVFKPTGNAQKVKGEPFDAD